MFEAEILEEQHEEAAEDDKEWPGCKSDLRGEKRAGAEERAECWERRWKLGRHRGPLFVGNTALHWPG